MLRLGRRGIILSLFINGLNIFLYLIILVAACLNIVEASVNFIILNAFAAAFACLLIVSEIRLPQLTYEYFRFLCTYRGRGLTYLFFGCLVASRIAFNLYGGIMVVCMGLAFFLLSYVKMIPPLDGLILNYKKLDQWKEQKHFRVQLEAQRIFEQQLQQEQNLARVIPAHHHNSLTVHGHIASPKQIRPISGAGAGSTNFSGTGANSGAGVGSGAGALKTIFTPPMSQQQHQPLGIQEPQFPHHQPQVNQYGSVNNLTSEQNTTANQECKPSSGATPAHGDNSNRFAIGRGKGRVIQNCVPQNEPQMSEVQKQQVHPSFREKNLPTIVDSENDSASYVLSPPSVRRRTIIESEPGSPLQYLNVGEDSVDIARGTVGNMIESQVQDDRENCRDNNYSGKEIGNILKSAPNPIDSGSQQLHQKLNQAFKLDQQQFPLRTTNKPAPPHDPFRKTSISSIQVSNGNLVSSLGSSTPTYPSHHQPNPVIKSGRAQYQSLYQPPEPPNQSDKNIQSPQQSNLYYSDSPSVNRRIPVPLTATGQILSSIGGISGCYGIVGGVPGAVPLATPSIAAPMAPVMTPSMRPGTHNYHGYGSPNYTSPNTPRQQAFGRQQLQPPKHLQEESHKQYMPDIVLTLPTPAEAGNGQRRQEYFAV
ncbi:hypothetical protein BGZ76_005064 [Entomortierella beljakovae]|nr:hypothetical protein BGZ76_005064 [Entomortierella beljakovae]